MCVCVEPAGDGKRKRDLLRHRFIYIYDSRCSPGLPLSSCSQPPWHVLHVMTLQRYGTKHPNRKHACISVTFMSRSRQEQQIINSTRHVHVVLWSLFRYPTLECTTPTTPTSQPSERIFFVSCQHTVSHSRTHTLIFTNSYTGIHEYHGTYSRIRFGHHTSMSIINTHEYGEESTYTHCHAARIPYPIRKSICSTKCFTNMRIFLR